MKRAEVPTSIEKPLIRHNMHYLAHLNGGGKVDQAILSGGQSRQSNKSSCCHIKIADNLRLHGSSDGCIMHVIHVNPTVSCFQMKPPKWKDCCTAQHFHFNPTVWCFRIVLSERSDLQSYGCNGVGCNPFIS